MAAPAKHPKKHLRDKQAKLVRQEGILRSAVPGEPVLRPRIEIIQAAIANACMLKEAETANPVEGQRQKRLQAIDLIFGIWRHRTDVAKDGLTYQEEMRAEW
jgi:hypothetical protein